MSESNTFNLSFYSSPSSEENEAYNGTPATKLTEFSPEDARADARPTVDASVGIENPPIFALSGVQSKNPPRVEGWSSPGVTSQDPFRSDVKSSIHCQPSTPVKLSATAQTFKPRLSTTLEAAETPRINQVTASSPASIGQSHTTTAMGYLRATSVPDSDEPNPTSKNGSSAFLAGYGAVMPPIAPRSLPYADSLPPSNYSSPDSSPPDRAE